MQPEFCRQIFEKSLNIKLHENPSIGSRVVPGGETDTRTVRRNEANTVVAFRDFAISLNESEDFTCCHQWHSTCFGTMWLLLPKTQSTSLCFCHIHNM